MEELQKNITKRELVFIISKEANLSEYDTNLLQHDINNLRGHEWNSFVKKYCSKETHNLFREIVGLKTKRRHFAVRRSSYGCLT